VPLRPRWPIHSHAIVRVSPAVCRSPGSRAEPVRVRPCVLGSWVCLADCSYSLLRPPCSPLFCSDVWLRDDADGPKRHGYAGASRSGLPSSGTAVVTFLLLSPSPGQVLEEVAAQHGLAVLLQEKPFQGANGSGKVRGSTRDATRASKPPRYTLPASARPSSTTTGTSLRRATRTSTC